MVGFRLINARYMINVKQTRGNATAVTGGGGEVKYWSVYSWRPTTTDLWQSSAGRLSFTLDGSKRFRRMKTDLKKNKIKNSNHNTYTWHARGRRIPLDGDQIARRFRGEHDRNYTRRAGFIFSKICVKWFRTAAVSRTPGFDIMCGVCFSIICRFNRRVLVFRILPRAAAAVPRELRAREPLPMFPVDKLRVVTTVYFGGS